MRKGSPWALWSLNFSLSLSVMAEAAPSIRKLSLEMKEFFLLTALDDNPNPAELARALITPKPTVTFMVKRMEAAGYVKRELEPDDLRRFRLTLTAPGRKAMEKARDLFEEAFGRRLGRLTQAQRAELQRLLEQMSAAE
jgi:DNA-binding MarR family transcriptional regulator